MFAIILAVAAGMTLFDLLLVREAGRHKSQTGIRLFERGLAARKAGRSAEALELLRAAYSRDPRNPEYHLAFAQALDSAGRVREGRAALEEFLTRYPAHGPANAEMARLLSREDWQRAAWYYHRALYGEWKGSPDLRALRFELADLLARNNAREQLASEVVLLDAEPADPAEAKHLARLRLAAGEWSRAEALYRSLLRANPEDPELLIGLARAEIGSGRYVAAGRALRRAAALGASDQSVGQDLELVTRINAMDPTLRGLSPAEKHRRAHELASTLLGLVRACSPENAVAGEVSGLLKEHSRKRNDLSLAEEDLDLFDRLWTVREHACGAHVQIPRALQLLAAELTK